MAASLSIEQINALSYEDFILLFGNVIEHCALCAASVWRNRPFENINHLHDVICCFLQQLPKSGKEGVLRLHPDLAGRLAQQGCLTSESTAEQRAAGLDTLTEDEKAILREANAEYKKKFGFPFVICARQNKKDAILIGIQQRLLNISDVELVNGIAEVEKICYLRLQQLVNNPQTNVKM